MTLDEAIKRNNNRLAELDKASRHKMTMYQTGHITKEQHNEVQAAINQERLSIRLGIEALEAIRQGRREGRQLSCRELLPSETEGGK